MQRFGSGMNLVASGELHGGAVLLVMGPMFSGKTTEMMRRLRRYRYAQQRVLLVKHARDTRYSVDKACTHDQVTAPAVGACKLADVEEKYGAMLDAADVVGVDEGQFFPDLQKYVESWANAGKIVVVAALDGDFQRRPFGQVLELLPMAEEVVKLRAVCMSCGRDASFTRRLSNETKVEVIGGADKYIAVCRRCYFSEHVSTSKFTACAAEQPPVRSQNNKRVSAAPPGSDLDLKSIEAPLQKPRMIQQDSAPTTIVAVSTL